MIFYPFTLRRTTASIFKEFQNEDNFLGILAKGLVEYWIIVLLFVALVAIMVKLYGKDRKPIIKSNWIAHYSVGLLFLLMGVGLLLGGLRGGFLHSTRPITLSNAAKYAEFPREINIVLNTPFAIYRTLGAESFEEKHYFEDKNELDQVFNPFKAAPDSVGEFKYDNVVIFIVESLGKEFIGTLNNDIENGAYEGYTPFIDSLLTKSKTYWHSFANGKKSIDAMPSILASIPSIKTPYVLSPYSGNKIDGLANVLNTKGYSTGFFHGAPNGSMGFLSFSKLAGFDKYYGKTEYNNDDDYDGIWGIWDDKFFEFYANSLNEMEQPFMGALFSTSSHHPYGIPEDFQGTLKEGPTPLHQCINYSDKSLELFFDKVSKLPWFENTLFVITADHTPSYPYYEQYRTASGLFKVPIIFYHPQHPEWADENREDLIQQIDITPSILGYLDYDQPSFAFGRNIFDSLSVPYVFNYQGNAYQYFYEDYLLQYDDGQEKTLALFNFKEDVLLRENIVGKMPEIQLQMETRVKALIQQYNYTVLRNEMSALD